MADRYWVGGTGTWNTTNTANWSTTDGGSGGASVPTSADAVYFSGSSGAGTVTISGTVVCGDLITFVPTNSSVSISASGATIQVYGLFDLSGQGSFTGTPAVEFLGGVGASIVSNGKTLGLVTINKTSGSIVMELIGALTSNNTITLTAGTFTTNGYNVTAVSFLSNNSNVRTINFGSSTIALSNTLQFTTATNLTFNAGTSQINLSNSALAFQGGGQTFYNVSFTSTAATNLSIGGANTFNNLTVTAPASAGVAPLSFENRQTINGTLSTTGTAGNRRVWFRGTTYGIAQTLTINSAPSLTDADFRDIYVIGTAAPISGTRIGDLRGIRGITASTPKTVYWNLAAGGNWSANAWAATSGGGVSTDNFPLAQDTAVIENTGLNTSATVTLDNALSNYATVDMSTRTNAMSFSTPNNITFYGDIICGSGTSPTSSATLTFSGRNTQTITSAGKSFANSFTVDSYGGTVQLADALNIGLGTLTVTNGTFNTQNYNVTTAQISSSNSNVRAINLGSSTVTLAGTPVIFTTSTNLTFNAGTSTLSCSGTTITFDGGGQTFYDVEFTNTGTSVKTVAGVNTFRNLVFAAPASAAIQQRIFSGNQTITGTLTVAGATAVRRGFLTSSVLGTPRTLTVNSLSAQDCDFRDITIAGAAAGSSPTRAGDCGGNTGITFPAPKTVYAIGDGTASNLSLVGWATSSGGSINVNNLPLAQDTAVVDNVTNAPSIAFNPPFNLGTFDSSSRTSAITLNVSVTGMTIYGDFKCGSGVTFSSTGNPLTFSKRGTQTITSNGVTFNNPITIDCASGTVQLADALTLNSARTLTLTGGTFDAVTYNVTTGLFSSSGAGQGGFIKTLKMGSGLWTLTGTGTVFAGDFSSSSALYKGTADILLSDTSATARTFAATGSGASYNKLTIGGTTGTSTLTFSGTSGCQFTELASTKTVAHTLALGTGALTIGKWTVTGTAGNVVTVTGTAALTIAGAAVSGVDYLALGATTVSTSSPGEFYAGANSTATGAAAPLYLTAKPADSTRYWVGGTGNWSDTARWSTGSGGAGGASVPRSHDDVVFNSASNATAYTATVNAVTGGIRCKALTIAGPASGNLTLAGSTAINGIHGNVTLPATGLTRTYTGAITLSGSTTGKTLTTNGVTLASAITVDGVGCEWTLGSALNIGNQNLTITNGLFDCATYSLIVGNILSTSLNKRTVNFGSSTVTLQSGTLNFGTTESVSADLIVLAGTSQINVGGDPSTFTGNGKTFYNVSFPTLPVLFITFNGANTFNNLTIAGRTSAGITPISLTANQTINGTLTLSAGTNATMRTFVQSNTIGTTRTLTCAAVASLTDIDFRDITIAGAAAPMSGTRLGDCKGNSGITFPAAKTVYYNLTSGTAWTSNVWSDVSGGTNSLIWFPLAQDTIIFPAATYPSSGQTVTLTTTFNLGTIDMSARTSNTMTLATGSTTPAIYGNWINGTGTTLTGAGRITMAGRTSQTITSAGVTFTQPFTVDSPSGTVTLQDAFTSSANVSAVVRVDRGTFDAATYNVTLSGASASVDSTTAFTRTIAVGSGTWTIAGPNGWSVSANGLSVTGNGTISLTSASAKAFGGSGIAYTNITLNQGGAGTLTISGNNTFKDITNTYKATGATNITLGTTTQTVANFTASGEAGRVLTVQGTSASSPATLIYTGAGQAAQPAIDYLTITGVRAYSLDTTWYAGANSTNNGSLGWYFEAGGGGPIAVYIIESATGNSSEAAAGTLNSTISELSTGGDAALGGLTYLGTLSESATAADVARVIDVILAAINESASAQDLAAVVASAFSATAAEIAAARDTTQATATFPTALSESAQISDTNSAALNAGAAVSESAAALDAGSSLAVFGGQIAELVIGLDAALVAASTFSASASEIAQARDFLNAPGSIYNVSMSESANLSDSFVGSYLWNPIDDTQTPNWQNINNAQSVTWTTVPDTQNPGWVIIPTSND